MPGPEAFGEAVKSGIERQLGDLDAQYEARLIELAQEQAASELTALRAKLAAANERADRNAAAVDAQARAIAEAVEAERAACEAVARNYGEVAFMTTIEGDEVSEAIADAIAARKGGPK